MDDVTAMKIEILQAGIEQLERDVTYLLNTVAVLNARIMAINERERQKEDRLMRGVR